MKNKIPFVSPRFFEQSPPPCRDPTNRLLDMLSFFSAGFDNIPNGIYFSEK